MLEADQEDLSRQTFGHLRDHRGTQGGGGSQPKLPPPPPPFSPGGVASGVTLRVPPRQR